MDWITQAHAAEFKKNRPQDAHKIEPPQGTLLPEAIGGAEVPRGSRGSQGGLF